MKTGGGETEILTQTISNLMKSNTASSSMADKGTIGNGGEDSAQRWQLNILNGRGRELDIEAEITRVTYLIQRRTLPGESLGGLWPSHQFRRHLFQLFPAVDGIGANGGLKKSFPRHVG